MRALYMGSLNQIQRCSKYLASAKNMVEPSKSYFCREENLLFETWEHETLLQSTLFLPPEKEKEAIDFYCMEKALKA